MQDLKNELINALVHFNKNNIIEYDMTKMSKSEIILLFMLYFKKDNMCAKDLTKKICVSKSMMTAMLNNLEEKDYIKKTYDKNDGRKIYIDLTKKGNNFVKSSVKSFDVKFEKLINVIGYDDLKTFLDILNKIMEVNNYERDN